MVQRSWQYLFKYHTYVQTFLGVVNTLKKGSSTQRVFQNNDFSQKAPLLDFDDFFQKKVTFSTILIYHSSEYHLLKIDKDRFLLSFSHFDVSCDAIDYTYIGLCL